MAFRKFGGLEYNKKNNYVSSNINNNINLNITEQIGAINTKIVAKSHLDLDGQTMFNVGNVIFANGLDIEQMLGNVDLMNNEAIQSIFTKNNTWSGVNTFTNTTLMSSLQVGTNCQINSNGSISGSSLATAGPISGSSLLTTGNITGGAISGTSLSTGSGNITGGPISGTSLLTTGNITGGAISGTSLSTGSGIITGGAISGTSLSTGSGIITGGAISGTSLSTSGTITGNILTITGLTGTIDGNPILTSAGLTGYASLTDTNPQSFAGPISAPSFGLTGASGPVSLYTNSVWDSLVVETTQPNTGIILSSNGQVVSMTCPSTGVLEVGGSLQVGETGGTGIIYCSNVNFSGASGSVSLYTNTLWDSLVVETTQPNTGIVLSSNGNDVSLTCPSTGVLEVGGSLNTNGVNFTLPGGTLSGASLFPTSGGQLIAEVTSLEISGSSTNATTTLTPQDANLYINTSITLPAQIYNPTLTYGNVSATQQFVQDAVLYGNFTGTISVAVSNANSIGNPTAFSFTQTLNTNQQTNNYSMVQYQVPLANPTDSTISFTLTFPSFVYPTGTTPTLSSGLTCYGPITNQTFSLQISFINNTTINCSLSSPCITSNDVLDISGQLNVSWT